MTTVTLSSIPELTASTGAPRVAAIEYPCGRPPGQPGDAGEAAVLRAALRLARTATRPGTVEDLPFEWPEPPSRVRSSPPEPPPIVKLLKHRPWLLPRLLQRNPPGKAGTDLGSVP